MVPGPPGEALTPAERVLLDALRGAETLAALVEITGADDEHEAYFAAKRMWRELRGAELDAEPPDHAVGPGGGLPGATVIVDGTTFHVHGVTHADTGAEREYLRAHVREFLRDGEEVYCEQGVRRMYFENLPAVYEMDDSLWAMQRCRELDSYTGRAEFPGTAVDELLEDVTSLASRFQERTFSLVESSATVYGEEFADALGDVASTFLTSHESLGMGREFESFAASKRAATDPTRLGDLQRYYERAFLPQPLEREWLRRHDPELEIVTHARNERMADYAVYHSDGAGAAHLIVGAAHQPGVRYYLERHRDGERTTDGFEFVG